MKIIDLLNKIANGEDVPEKIKINNIIYEYRGDDYLFKDKNNDNHEYWLFSNGYTDKFQWLDSFLKAEAEVEIIEEDKKIEKLNNIPINYADDRTPEEVYEYLRCTINNLANVINISNENLFKLIDKVNNMENDK